MNLEIASYNEQKQNWPEIGRYIMAQYDDDSIVVYQAYRPAIGLYAAQHGFFGGEFKYTRMSWIKPNFLWMMYRSGWGTKEGQEITLAIRLKRTYFDMILSQSVPSSNDKIVYPSKEDWQEAVANSDVRLQWDPDHDPTGAKEERRAIQLGLRGDILEGFKGFGLVSVTDISDFVAEQRQFAQRNFDGLMTPLEKPYPASDPETIRRLRLD